MPVRRLLPADAKYTFEHVEAEVLKGCTNDRGRTVTRILFHMIREEVLENDHFIIPKLQPLSQKEDFNKQDSSQHLLFAKYEPPIRKILLSLSGTWTPFDIMR